VTLADTQNKWHWLILRTSDTGWYSEQVTLADTPNKWHWLILRTSDTGCYSEQVKHWLILRTSKTLADTQNKWHWLIFRTSDTAWYSEQVTLADTQNKWHWLILRTSNTGWYSEQVPLPLIIPSNCVPCRPRIRRAAWRLSTEGGRSVCKSNLPASTNGRELNLQRPAVTVHQPVELALWRDEKWNGIFPQSTWPVSPCDEEAGFLLRDTVNEFRRSSSEYRVWENDSKCTAFTSLRDDTLLRPPK